MDGFPWTRWLRAVTFLSWLTVSIIAALREPSWIEAGITFAIMLGAAVVTFIMLKLLIGLFAMVFVSPVQWLIERRSGTQHGSARWMRPSEIRRHWLDRPGTVYLGAWRDWRGRQHALTSDGQSAHTLVLGASRSGKTSGCVIPTALAWPYSMVANDWKGELHTLTSGYRRGPLGQLVLRFAPAEPDSCSFNFLDPSVVRIGTDREVGDILNIMTTLTEGDSPPQGEAAHWVTAAAEMLAGVALWCLYKARDEGTQASLGDVTYAISNPAMPATKLFETMARHPHHFISAVGQTQLNRSDREESSVISTGLRFLLPWRDKTVCDNTDTCDFSLDDICGNERPTSVYLVTRAADAARMAPVLKLFLAVLTNHLMSAELRFDSGGLALPPWRNRCLLLLDEFSSLGHCSVLEAALSRLAGFGVIAILCVQSMRQITAAYGQSSAIVANTNVRAIFGVAELSDAEWVSRSIGTTTVAVEQRSRHGIRWGAIPTTSIATAYNPRALVTPDEVLSSDPDGMFILEAGRHPLRARRLRYWTDPVMVARAAGEEPALAGSVVPFPTPRAVPAPIRAAAAALALVLVLSGAGWGGYSTYRHQARQPLSFASITAGVPQLFTPQLRTDTNRQRECAAIARLDPKGEWTPSFCKR